MSEDLSHDKTIAKLYKNNGKYSTIRNVGLALGRGSKNTRNYSSILRRRNERERKVPNFIWHGSQESTSSYAKKIEKKPRQHNKVKTKTLTQEVQNIFVVSDYPATNPSEQAFQIMATSAVIRPRVTLRQAGVRSIFNHVPSVTLVEFDDDVVIFFRQIIADNDEKFQDLDVKVGNGCILNGQSISAVTAADVHIAKLDRCNAISTFGYDPETRKLNDDENSIINTLKSEFLILLDLSDRKSRNYHNANDVSHNYKKAIHSRESVLEKLRCSADFFEQMDRPELTTFVTKRNYNLTLERYSRQRRHRGDDVNFELGFELDIAYRDYGKKVAEAFNSHKTPPRFSMVKYAIRHVIRSRLRNKDWVYDSDSYLINDIQVGNHGFRGANGAKGAITGFARLRQKITIGDNYSPTILDGVYVAGVMQLQHGYNKGLSSWVVSHVIQYKNSSHTNITIEQGHWRKNVTTGLLGKAA